MRTTGRFRSSTLVLILAALLGLPTPSSLAENSGDWLAHGRTAAEQRYSPLETINHENVASMIEDALSPLTRFNDPKGVYSHCFCAFE